MHTYIHTYKHTYIHTCINPCIKYKDTCIDACMQKQTCCRGCCCCYPFVFLFSSPQMFSQPLLDVRLLCSSTAVLAKFCQYLIAR